MKVEKSLIWMVAIWNSIDGRIVWYAKSSAASLMGKGWHKSKGIMTIPKFWNSPSSSQPLTDQTSSTATTTTATSTGHSSDIEIYVEKYRRNHRAHNHLILLAGGPGQSSSVWHQDLYQFGQLVGSDTAIYLIDHRGLGRSSFEKVFSNNSYRRRSRLSHHFDPTWINPTEAAHDVAHLAKLIKHRQRSEGGRIILLGVSYGGWWAARTVALYPNLFDWLLLDSPSMIEHRFDIKNDDDFWQQCLNDRGCRKALVGKGHDKDKNIKKTRKIYHRVMQGAVENSCTEAWRRKSPISVSEAVRPYLRGAVDIGSGLHSAMLVVPFIAALYRCDSLPRFQNRIMPGFLRYGKIKEETAEGGCPIEGNLYGLSTLQSRRSASSFELHDFVNTYLCVGELYNYERETPKVCQRRSHLLTVTDQCVNYGHYQKDYQSLKNHLYSREEDPRIANNALTGTYTRLIILTGGMDVITPPRPVRKWLKKWVESSYVRLVNYRKRGHGAAPDAPCLEHLFNGIIRGCETSLAHFYQCVRQENDRLPDWTLRECNLDFARKWLSISPF